MAKRIYKAKDKLVQRRVRGAMVEENVRTKKRRRIGKKDAELDVNMARGPNERLSYQDELSEGEAIAAQRTKARKRGDNRYDRTPDRDPQPSRSKRKRVFRERDQAIDTAEVSIFENDGFTEDKPSERAFRRRSRLDERGSARRLRFDEEEKRLESESFDSSEHDFADSPETDKKAQKQRHLLSGDDGIQLDDGFEDFPDELEESVESPNNEASSKSEERQRRRKQASAFREECAKKEAYAETFETLADGETARTESAASARRKSRLNFSDEGYGFANGIGRLGKHAVKTSVVPAMAYTRQQIHEAAEENEGVHAVEAGGIAARKTTSLVQSSKRSSNRRSVSKTRAESVKQEHAAQVEHRKKEQIRAFHKKKRQRAAIAARRKQSVVSAGGFVDSADTMFSIPEKAKKAAQSFFAEHKGAIIGVAAVGIIFALIGVSMSSVASLVHGGGTTVISTTYVSTDEDIYAAENAYRALEDGLNGQINSVQSTHPGFDDYEYQVDEIDHNPYQLISYLQVKFGGFTYNDEIKDEIRRLFRQQYTISLSEGSEIRTRTETVIETREEYDEETGLTAIVEYPVEQEVEYEHWTQYTVLTNRNFDIVARSNMTEEEIILYEALNKTFGNRPYLFDLTEASGVGASGIQFDIPPEALSDTKFANMIREAEKYLGMPYVWGGKSVKTGFDCSGFVCWVINHCGNGWNVGQKRAKELCRMCTYVSPSDARPGDLVFFEKTYDTDGASHVGIYVGNNTMIHCGHPIKYGRIDTRYFKAHFLCFGRLPFYDD